MTPAVQAVAAQPEHHLAMVTVLQNEARWLPEWLEYHASVGVDHFFLYDDASTDGLRMALRPFVDARLVTLTNVSTLGAPPTHVLTRGWNDAGEEHSREIIFAPQYLAVTHAIAVHGHRCRWMAFFDVDEFVAVPSAPGAGAFAAWLRRIAHRRPDAGGVRLFSVLMLPRNATDAAAPPADALVIKSFIRRANDGRRSSNNDPHHIRFKCVLRPDAKDRRVYGNIHHLALTPGREMYAPPEAAAHVCHFRYRWRHTFETRLRKGYLANGTNGSARGLGGFSPSHRAHKAWVVGEWRSSLFQMWTPTCAGTCRQHMHLLRHVDEVRAGLYRRYAPLAPSLPAASHLSAMVSALGSFATVGRHVLRVGAAAPQRRRRGACSARRRCAADVWECIACAGLEASQQSREPPSPPSPPPPPSGTRIAAAEAAAAAAAAATARVAAATAAGVGPGCLQFALDALSCRLTFGQWRTLNRPTHGPRRRLLARRGGGGGGGSGGSRGGRGGATAAVTRRDTLGYAAWIARCWRQSRRLVAVLPAPQAQAQPLPLPLPLPLQSPHDAASVAGAVRALLDEGSRRAWGAPAGLVVEAAVAANDTCS